MAQSYDRRINLYINIDGKEVNNNVKSIRAEMQKLVNAQKMMTIGSQEYHAATQKIKYLNGILSKHSDEVRDVKKSWSMQGMADGFNRYMGMVTAFLASAAGVVLGFKQIIKSFNDYEERVDNLSALTGLAGDNLEWLSDKAKELSQSTLDGGIRVTQSAQEIVDAFTKTGSARPELLKNKEALVAVTQEAIILSNAAKTELQPAIEALTMVMNQYNVGADQARRIINVLAAGSKEGAGEVPYLTVAFEKAGTVASLAGISIESLAATIETLAPRISQPEIAGRSLKGIILDLQNGADDTNPAIVGMATAIENLGKKNLSVTELTKKFGTENINTAQILIANVGELKNYEAAMTGTNVAIEQAITNTDNNNAKLAQAKNRLNVMSIELGEKLAPALQMSTNGLSYFIKGLTVSIDFFNKNKAVIITLIVSITAYTIATKLQAIWEARTNKEKLISITLGKLQALAYNAQFAAISLYNAGLALMKGNLAAASIQFRAFSAALMANPIGLIVGLLVAAGTALYFYTGKLTAAQKAQQMMNDVNLQAQKAIVEEKINMQTLLDLARNEKLTKEERIKAIKQLNAISPAHLGFLKLENINTKEATAAVKDYTDELLKNARAQAAKEKLIEIEKELLDLQTGKGAEVSFWQQAGNAILSVGNASMMASRNAASAASNLTEKGAELTLQKEKLLGITREQVAEELKAGGGGGDDSGAQDLIKLKEAELQKAKEIIATTPAEVAARNQKVEAIQKEIDALNELGTSKQGESGEKADDKAIKKKVEAIEAANNAEMASIKKRHLEGKTSEDQYQSEILMQEMKFLSDKAAVFKVGSKEYEEAQMQLLEKQVTAEQKVKDLLKKAQDELANAKIDNLTEGIEKEKAIQEQRWKEELEGLKKQLRDKQNLSAEEIALNDTIQKTIEEKTAAHLKRMNELNMAGELQKQMDAALINEAKAGSDEEKWAAERELAQARYAQELLDAKGNAVLIAQAERRLSDTLVQIKTDELNRRQQIGDAVFGAANQLFGALVQLAGKESALGKAMFLFQQAAAIGQIIFNTAIANAAAVAASPLTFGQPWVTINTVTAGVSIASVLAQTIASFTQPKGYRTGGFTNGDKIYRAGEEGPEWIAPHWMLQDPVTRNIIAGLEDMRTNPMGVTSGAFKASQSNNPGNGNNGGSYAGNTSVPVGSPAGDGSSLSGISFKEMKRFNDIMDRLEKKDFSISVETYERTRKSWDKVTSGGLS